MTEDRTYCASSYLMFRTVADENKCFRADVVPKLYHHPDPSALYPIHTSGELFDFLRARVAALCEGGRTALALSGGIDSAILARFMPKGSVAYTFKCIVPGMQVTDETPAAARYAQACGLEHRIVEVYWEDFEAYAPLLMKHKGAPVHSIEVQIYKAALRAKADGMDRLVFGESADCNYGGLNNLLSKDWTIGEFIDRYTYVKPYQVLKESELILAPYRQYERDGKIDVHAFLRGFFLPESLGSYVNAGQCAGLDLKMPYAETWLAEPLDLNRVRAGENKYLIREVFRTLYEGFTIPPKTPMPRPMNEWMTKWAGPVRREFWPHCTDNMTGDQKWLVWCLERFLNLLEREM